MIDMNQMLRPPRRMPDAQHGAMRQRATLTFPRPSPTDRCGTRDPSLSFVDILSFIAWSSPNDLSRRNICRS